MEDLTKSIIDSLKDINKWRATGLTIEHKESGLSIWINPISIYQHKNIHFSRLQRKKIRAAVDNCIDKILISNLK